jgi:hypothetical protein
MLLVQNGATYIPCRFEAISLVEKGARHVALIKHKKFEGLVLVENGATCLPLQV